MSRPIVLALAVLGGAGLTAALVVEKLAGSVRERPPAAMAATASGSAAPLERSVRLASDGRGHFQAEIAVDGARLRMLVDTGASFVALRESDARRAGLQLSAAAPEYRLSTANGIVTARGIRVREMRLGPIIVRDVEALILPDAQLGSNLLGMSFLNRLRSFEVSGQELILRG